MLISRLGVIAAAVLLCAGCGTGQREVDARLAAAGFLAATGGGDLGAACALLASDTREDLETSQGRPCASALGSVDIAGGRVGEVAVWGDRAQAHATGGTLFLVELADGWRVAAAGCTRSADGTYDCLLAS